jgi:serine/threonine-protein kinase
VSTSFGRYKVIEEIGRGAMGVVYRAHDPAIQRPVAIKVINEKYLASVGVESGEYFERFRREAEVAGRLSHRGVVRIYDLGPNYIVMELIVGQTLATLMSARVKQHLSRILDIVGQVAAALDYAHGQGIVHRDIKPANIMVEADGTVRVMDFGLARIDSSTLTAAGEILGSASYMAPELVRGRPASPKSDLFSLGVVAYELMTGDRPFGGASISAIIHNIIETTPRPVHTLNLNLPPDYDAIFARALAKEPDARYPSAGAFAEALILKKWADRDPTITGPLPEASLDAPTMIGETVPSTAAGSPAQPGPSEPTVVLESGSLAETTRDNPASDILPAAPAPPTGEATPSRRPGGGLLTGVALGCGALLLVAAVVAAVLLARAFLPRAGAPPAREATEGPTPSPMAPQSATEPTAPAGATSATPPPVAAPTSAPVLAVLSIASEPSGARVSVGRVPRGLTPLRLELPPRRVAVLVEKEGFEPWRKEVTLREGSEEALKAELRRAPSPLAAATPLPEPPVMPGDLVPLTDDVTPPRRISGDPPRLPRSISGLKTTNVVLEFNVASDGSVQETRVLQSGGAVLDKACLDAVARWRYEPATKKGVRVKVVQTARFRFEF